MLHVLPKHTEIVLTIQPTTTAPIIQLMITRTANSESCWKLANEWLSQCKAAHDRCCVTLTERSLSTRLIFVGSTNLEIRLCLSNQLPPGVEYPTLSHCWGKLRFKTLTTQPLPSMLVSIDASILAKPFQGAIDAMIRLGHKYIWIGSLCILQDSEEGWQYESQRMSQVYCKSSLNLAASAATDSNTENSPIPACGVTVAHDPPSKQRSTWSCMPDHWAITLLNTNPLGKRGWVVQEQCWAPRALHFGSSQIV